MYDTTYVLTVVSVRPDYALPRTPQSTAIPPREDWGGIVLVHTDTYIWIFRSRYMYSASTYIHGIGTDMLHPNRGISSMGERVHSWVHSTCLAADFSINRNWFHRWAYLIHTPLITRDLHACATPALHCVSYGSRFPRKIFLVMDEDRAIIPLYMCVCVHKFYITLLVKIRYWNPSVLNGLPVLLARFDGCVDKRTDYAI